MTNTTYEPGWIAVENYADGTGIRPSELVSSILDGRLSGARFGDRWYLAPPLARLEHPRDGDLETGYLILSVCKLGSYLTAGRLQLRISLAAGDPGPALAFKMVSAAMRARRIEPVEIRLGQAKYCIDSSLWVDLNAALIEWDVLNNGLQEEALTQHP